MFINFALIVKQNGHFGVSSLGIHPSFNVAKHVWRKLIVYFVAFYILAQALLSKPNLNRVDHGLVKIYSWEYKSCWCRINRDSAISQ